MIQRGDALKAVRENVQNQNLIKHMLATEAIMRALARKYREDETEWGLTGLLHDIDVDLCAGDMTQHSKLGADMIREMGGNQAMVHAILTHNDAHGIPCESLIDKALFCADPLTGLIIAAALVRPDKKMTGVEIGSVRKRFKEKSFAVGANREQIAACTQIGLELDEFITLGLTAMQGISGELGL
jgi:putative nucleotidyltransferase with HDIG domain